MMDAAFSSKDQKVLVKYLHLMKNEPKDIHKLLTIACGKSVADYKIVKGWIQFLETGNDENEEDVPVEGPNGIQVNVLTPPPTDPAMVQRIEALICSDKRISYDRLHEMSLIPKKDIQDIITNVLGLKRVTERWVPRLWTPEQRDYRIQVAKELWDKYEVEGEGFLRKIVCGDETFVHYYNPDKLNIPTAPHRRLSKGIAEERFRPIVEPVKVHFIFFYDCKGMIIFHQVPQEATLDAEYYAKFIRNELIPALKRKRKLEPHDIYLLHDNTPIHNALQMQRTLKETGLEALPHAPASPDMEPHEYFLFSHLKNQMRSTPFQNAITISSTISHHIISLPDSHYENSIRKLAARWEHGIDSRGLYVL